MLLLEKEIAQIQEQHIKYIIFNVLKTNLNYYIKATSILRIVFIFSNKKLGAYSIIGMHREIHMHLYNIKINFK